MGLKDIDLDNLYSQKGVKNTNPMAGEKVDIEPRGEYIDIRKNNQQIAALSKSMVKNIRQKQKDGYELSKAEIENVVEWKKEDKKYKQVLCKIYLARMID